MLLNLRALRGGRAVLRGEIAPDDALLEGFFGRLMRPLEVTARISEQPHRTYLVTLEVRGEVESPCRRCLQPAQQPLEERLDLLYEVREPGAPSATDSDEDVDVVPLRSELEPVDVRPAVREALLLAVQSFPLCRPECRGLCPGCGRDLNVETCSCVTTTPKPRWRGLEKLRS
jgi:uncharacterized protein